jgi:dimeric dUTPase (all-alpha-NTP-PPase superfamily)
MQNCVLIERKSFVLDALKCFWIWCLSVSKVVVLEESMEGKHFVISCTLTMNNQEIPTHAHIDS